MRSCRVEQAQRFHRSPPDLCERPHNDRLGCLTHPTELQTHQVNGSASVRAPRCSSAFHGETPSLCSPLARAFTPLCGSTGSTITSHPRQNAAASLKPPGGTVKKEMKGFQRGFIPPRLKCSEMSRRHRLGCGVFWSAPERCPGFPVPVTLCRSRPGEAGCLTDVVDSPYRAVTQRPVTAQYGTGSPAQQPDPVFILLE